MTRPIASGFSFQQPLDQTVTVEIEKYLTLFQEAVEDFGKDESFATHVLEAAKSGNNEAIRAIDSKKFSHFSSAFWQTKKWFWSLQKVVPNLVLELTKYEPASKPLQKAYTFFAKPWKWSPKGLDPYSEVPTKYLSVLKDLRVALAAAQKAAAEAGKSGLRPVKVGRFELYDGMGAGEGAIKNAQRVLTEATSSMGRIGLDEFCYGKVTIVQSSSFAAKSAAFYVTNTDEIFISPDIGSQDVRAMCHEVAHRVYFKLNLRSQAQELYDAVKDRGVWVTGYAKTDALENFAEMVSFAAVGKLTEEAKPLLQATTRKIRVASRYLVAMGKFR